MTSWSDQYRKYTEEAIVLADRLGAPNRSRISPNRRVSDAEIETARNVIYDELFDQLESWHPGYWGTSCQSLATMIFAHLAARGFEVDMVVGEVEIQGNNEYDATLESIINDYESPVTSKPQNIHVWVSLGDDVIIDAGLSARLVKYYRMSPERDPGVVVERADWLSEGWHSKHIPMFVGTDYISKTNRIKPLNILNSMLSKYETDKYITQLHS